MRSTEAAGVSSAGTHQSGDQAGGRSYIVRADDPVSVVLLVLYLLAHTCTNFVFYRASGRG